MAPLPWQLPAGKAGVQVGGGMDDGADRSRGPVCADEDASWWGVWGAGQVPVPSSTLQVLDY